jgi:hypothetical protein
VLEHENEIEENGDDTEQELYNIEALGSTSKQGFSSCDRIDHLLTEREESSSEVEHDISQTPPNG